MPGLGIIEGLVGRRVEAVKRRGKFLQICISGGLAAELHLRMSGRLFWQKGGVPLPSRVPQQQNKGTAEWFRKNRERPPGFCLQRLMIAFPAGTLILIDPRRFATFTVQARESTPALVEDPSEGFPARRLRETARTRRLPVKSFLMDQRLIAGIGNIYACESSWRRGSTHGGPRRVCRPRNGGRWRRCPSRSSNAPSPAAERRSRTGGISSD